jgi:uncharacterized protein
LQNVDIGYLLPSGIVGKVGISIMFKHLFLIWMSLKNVLIILTAFIRGILTMRKIFVVKWSIYVLLFFSIISPSVQANDIGMVTGSGSGTYIKFGKAIAEKAKKAGVNIIVKESDGSIANIKRLNSSENAALAIVQSDVLGFLTRGEEIEFRRNAKRLRLIFPFYNEEVHLFANKEIKRFQDLQGKRVVLGTYGSGTWLTATNLLKIAGIKPAEELKLSYADAVLAVLFGEADAMFYVAGKPVQLFNDLNAMNKEEAVLRENVHFVPITNEKILDEYVKSDIGPGEYSWVKTTIPTVAVKAVLVSFDFSSGKSAYYRMRCKQLSKIGQSIRDNIGDLKQKGHPKWKEVDLEMKFGNWKLDKCSRSSSTPPQPLDSMKERIREYLTQ